MRYIYLINKDNNKFEKINFSEDKPHDIITKIYYLKYKVPTEKDIRGGNPDVIKYYKDNSLDKIKTAM